MRDANGDTLKPWRDNVRSATLDALKSETPFNADPVTVSVVFTFARPAAHFGTGRNKGTVKASAPHYPSSHTIGDLDKLVRACLDSLTDAGAFKDDSQVVTLLADKVWVGTTRALATPGAVITVLDIDPEFEDDDDDGELYYADTQLPPASHESASHSREGLSPL